MFMKIDIDAAFDSVRWCAAWKATMAAAPGQEATAHVLVREQEGTPVVAIIVRRRGVWHGATSSPRIFRNPKETAAARWRR